MVYLSKVGNSYNIPAQHYVCDTEDPDFLDLQNNTAIPIGSTAYVIENETLYEKGENDWCPLVTGGSGGTKIIKIIEKLPKASEVNKEEGRF